MTSDRSSVQRSDWLPTGGLHSLSDIHPPQGDNLRNHPTQMMLPETKIGMWNDVLIKVVQYLTDNGRLMHCSIKDPANDARYIIATEPTHPDDKPFEEGRTREVNSLFFEVNHTASDTARITRIIIERAGMDASQFKLRWESSNQFPQATIAGEWRPLSEAIGMGTSKLQGIMFPDGSSIATNNWNELTVEVVRWLTDNNHPVREYCPIQTREATTRYVVAEEPVRPSGEPHDGMIEVNSLWVLNDLHYEFAAGNARAVIERVGMVDPSEFKVLW